jgi:hypothetical protein
MKRLYALFCDGLVSRVLVRFRQEDSDGFGGEKHPLHYEGTIVLVVAVALTGTSTFPIATSLVAVSGVQDGIHVHEST